MSIPPKTSFGSTSTSSSSYRKSADAFNWLESTMTNLKIGKKENLASMTQQNITRNANVFQFPTPVQNGGGGINQAMRVERNATMSTSLVASSITSSAPMTSYSNANSSSSMTASKSTIFTSTANSAQVAKPPSYAPPPAMTPSQVRPQFNQTRPQFDQTHRFPNTSEQSFQSWPVRSQTPPTLSQQNMSISMMQNSMQSNMASQNASVVLSSITSNMQSTLMPTTMMPTMGSHMSSSMMSNTPYATAFPSKMSPVPSNVNSNPMGGTSFNFPRPNFVPQIRPQQIYQSPPAILQPQKVTQPLNQEQEQRQSKMFDKEFILELEKNLGLREATANLMPPSPAPSLSQTRPIINMSPSPTPSIPALRPPPQSTARNNSRRNTTCVTSSTVAEANNVFHQQQQRRDASVPRASQHNFNNSSPHQVSPTIKLLF